MKPFQMALPTKFQQHLLTNSLHPVLELTSPLAFSPNWNILPVSVPLPSVPSSVWNSAVSTSVEILLILKVLRINVSVRLRDYSSSSLFDIYLLILRKYVNSMRFGYLSITGGRGYYFPCFCHLYHRIIKTRKILSEMNM